MLSQIGERTDERPVVVSAGTTTLRGALGIPERPVGVVLFAHGSGSGRLSPRNRFVARQLREARLATLLLDLLTSEEEESDRLTTEYRFDIDLLAGRLVGAADWLTGNPETASLPLGCFGASTGAAAALIAAARHPDAIHAVVSRGGRVDLAGPALPEVRAPTLLIVGGNDEVVLDLNEDALERLGTEDRKLVVIAGAGHLFEEAGMLDQVSRLAANWFRRYLTGPAETRGGV